MNFKFLRKNVLLTGLACIAFVSCSKDETNETVSELSVDEVKNIAKADVAFESVFDIAKSDAFSAKPSGESKNSTTPCFLTNVIEIKGGKKITLDFGTGCSSFGKEYAGKVEIIYELIEGGYKKSLSFEGFSVNNTKVAGNSDFTFTLKNKEGNFFVSTKADLSVALENGENITRKGNWEFEKTEGSDTLLLVDDVFSMTGSWESVGKDGFTRTITVDEALITKFNCAFVVDGMLKIKKGDKDYTLDFGDGTCDSEAVFTNAKGETTVISL